MSGIGICGNSNRTLHTPGQKIHLLLGKVWNLTKNHRSRFLTSHVWWTRRTKVISNLKDIQQMWLSFMLKCKRLYEPKTTISVRPHFNRNSRISPLIILCYYFQKCSMANEAIHNSFPNICRKDYSVFDVKNGRAKKSGSSQKRACGVRRKIRNNSCNDT